MVNVDMINKKIIALVKFIFCDFINPNHLDSGVVEGFYIGFLLKCFIVCKVIHHKAVQYLFLIYLDYIYCSIITDVY
jgi:hypothetical protein